MRAFLHRQIWLCTLLALATGCVPRHIPLDPQFLATTSHRVGVALVPDPTLSAHRVGSSELANAIIAAADSNLDNHLRTLDVSPLTGLVDAFVGEFQARGLFAKRIEPRNLRQFQNLSAWEPIKSEIDQLASLEGVDSVLLLSAWCGTLRAYYGFIPAADPTGYCEIKGQLIDAKTGEPRWVGTFDHEKATAKVMGTWDQPPDYPNLTVAVRQAMARASEYMLRDFFKSHGSQRHGGPYTAKGPEGAPRNALGVAASSGPPCAQSPTACTQSETSSGSSGVHRDRTSDSSNAVRGQRQ